MTSGRAVKLRFIDDQSNAEVHSQHELAMLGLNKVPTGIN